MNTDQIERMVLDLEYAVAALRRGDRNSVEQAIVVFRAYIRDLRSASSDGEV